MGACARSGGCCMSVLLPYSPAELRASFRRARGTGSDVTVKLEDIEIVYPMLAGLCRGKYKRDDGKFQYVYGPCKHFLQGDALAGRLPGCVIHEDRPKLCSGYPLYERPEQIAMSAGSLGWNPGYMKGCGYNTDPNAGDTQEKYARENLIPIEDNEK